MRAAVAAAPAIVTSRLTFVEVSAALASSARQGRLADPAAAGVRFRADWASYVVVEMDPVLAQSAADLAAQHALRAYDAVQLASALVAAAGNPSAVDFATFDATLARAAAREGFRPGV